MEDKVEILDEDKKVLNEEFKDVRTPKKKSPIGLIILIIILMCGCLVGGYFINEKGLIKLGNEKETKEEKKKETKKEENLIITDEQQKNMQQVADAVFEVEKEKLETKDLTDGEKVNIAVNLAGKKYKSGYLEVTGTQMLEIFKNNFGKDQTINFVPIKCNEDHGSEEQNQMLIFDKAQDKYVYNDKHPGHGGGGSFYGAKLGFESIETTKDTVKYNVKVLFYGKAVSFDTGGMRYGNGYKTYKDSKEGKNQIVQIDDNSKYTVQQDGPPYTDIDAVFSDYKDQLDTYTFTFVKEDDNLIFKSYSKK